MGSMVPGRDGDGIDGPGEGWGWDRWSQGGMGMGSMVPGRDGDGIDGPGEGSVVHPPLNVYL